jgi:hypothetical protein
MALLSVASFALPVVESRFRSLSSGQKKTRLRGPQGDPVRNPNTYSSFSIFLDGQDEARIASGTNHALHYEGKEIYTDYT